jgi:glutathione S-transferase
MIRLHDLAGADPALRFSPYCWRTKLALAHKGLDFEALPWRFTERDRLPEGHRTVPVIHDADRIVGDSWAIACYLEESYPERPSLFGCETGRAHAAFVNAWADRVMVAGIAPLVVADIWGVIHDKDRAYFRESREKRMGGLLEDVQADRDSRVESFRASLAPLRHVLKTQDFVGGEAPSYADYIVFGTLEWGRRVSEFPLLAAEDAVFAWRERLAAMPVVAAASAPR